MAMNFFRSACTHARPGHLAARVSALSSQAADQAFQLALSLNVHINLDRDFAPETKISTQENSVLPPHLAARKWQLHGEMDRQLAALMDTICSLQALVAREQANR